jgi:three-Cys-motif partner protein
MADQLPTVWPSQPHTRAKHAILQRYLEAWFPILTRQASRLQQQHSILKSQEILFIDGFAGPGEYERGEPGSPVVALKAALDHSASFPVPVRMLFIEHRQDRFEHLKRVLAPFLETATRSLNVRAVDPRQGDCDIVLNDMLDEYERNQTKFGPALAFLDQFGYGAVSMDLIARILQYPQCEVFTYLDYKDMNRWITDKNKWAAFTRAYGGEEWRQCIDLPEERRRASLLAAYKAALRDKSRAGAKYVTSFLMFDNSNQPLYWLFFCTNNLRGLEEMKKAMWFVDNSGAFRFSDSDAPGQLGLFNDRFDQEWLAHELAAKLSGQTMTVAQIKEYVLVETPCYLFKAALKSLEIANDPRLKAGKAPAGRKRGQYPDDMLEEIVVQFEASLFVEGS